MHGRRLTIVALSGWLVGRPGSVPDPADDATQGLPVLRPATDGHRHGPPQAVGQPATAIAGRDEAGGSAAAVLTPQMVDDLSDTLTVLMCCLEQLARQPLTQAARRQVAQADAATSRSSQLLWQSVRARSLGPVVPPHLPSRLEGRS